MLREGLKQNGWTQRDRCLAYLPSSSSHWSKTTISWARVCILRVTLSFLWGHSMCSVYLRLGRQLKYFPSFILRTVFLPERDFLHSWSFQKLSQLNLSHALLYTETEILSKFCFHQVTFLNFCIKEISVLLSVISLYNKLHPIHLLYISIYLIILIFLFQR